MPSPKLLFPLSLLVCLAGCGKTDEKPAGDKPAAPAASAKKAFDVVTTTVVTNRVTYEIEAVGTLIEENRFQIPARVAGVADQVNFAEGDTVTTGQVLARIDYERNDLQVRQFESALAEKSAAAERAKANVSDIERSTNAALATARIDLDLAQSEYRRRSDAGANAFTSPEERAQFEAKYRQAETVFRDAVSAASTQVDLARAEHRETEAAYETARAQLALSRDNLERSTVKAPIAGVVQQRAVVEGQFVNQGDMIALMVQSDPLRLRFTVPESRIARLSRDMRLNFAVPAYGGLSFTGTVYDIGAFADQETREVICWARVTNPDSVLKPGFFAHVNLEVDSKAEAIVVPLSAILPTEQGMTAYVIEDGIARRRPVETGLNVTGDAIEILGGIKPDEQLVVEGMNALQDGVPVRVLPGARGIDIDDKKVSASLEATAGKTKPTATASTAPERKPTEGIGG